MTVAFLLICVAVLLLGTAHIPTPHGWGAVVLAVLAIIFGFLGWQLGTTRVHAQVTNIGFYVHHLYANQPGGQEAALCYAALFGNDIDAFWFVSGDPSDIWMDGPHYSFELRRVYQDGVDHYRLTRIKNSSGARTDVGWVLFQTGFKGPGQIIYQTIDNPLPQYRLAQCQVASNSTGLMYGVIP